MAVFIVLIWEIFNGVEAYTELTPTLIQLNAQANQISVDKNKMNSLSKLVDHQSEQLEKINAIISTLQNNRP